MRTFGFALAVVRLCRSLETCSGTVRSLSRQLLKAGTSVGANVEEAQAGQSRADFASKYAIALKEAREAIYWLRLLDATAGTTDHRCKELIAEAEEIAKIVGSIVVKARGQVKH